MPPFQGFINQLPIWPHIRTRPQWVRHLPCSSSFLILYLSASSFELLSISRHVSPSGFIVFLCLLFYNHVIPTGLWPFLCASTHLRLYAFTLKPHSSLSLWMTWWLLPFAFVFLPYHIFFRFELPASSFELFFPSNDPFFPILPIEWDPEQAFAKASACKAFLRYLLRSLVAEGLPKATSYGLQCRQTRNKRTKMRSITAFSPACHTRAFRMTLGVRFYASTHLHFYS